MELTVEIDGIEQEHHCVLRELLEEGGNFSMSDILYPVVYGHEVILIDPRKGLGLCSIEFL